ncbi:MAG: hypothetical protein MJ016_05835 [Victivallaceae bacterium]|nr:hypothetical protein [Victivallaceae bacterium]
MFQHLVQYLGEIAFFHSLFYGIAAMVLVGSSWCLVGLVMGDAPKRGIDPALVQLCGGFFSIGFGTAILFVTQAFSTAPADVTRSTLFVYFLGGAVNFAMLQTMSKAMQKGPNGIIWGIIQSSLIFPFLVGVTFFGVPLSAPRATVIILLLTALALFSSAKNNAVTGKETGGLNWKALALIAMTLAATQQNLSTAPSYFPETHKISSILRSIATAGGTFCTAVVFTLVRRTPELREKLRFGIRSKTLWKYVAALQLFNLLFSYCCLYPGMDTMADHGLGGMCYPLMIGSCIISFTLASAIFLKEKITLLQIGALCVCLLGLTGICLPAGMTFSVIAQKVTAFFG